MISLKLNFDKIDQSKMFKGAKGRYLDLILMESRDSAYGDDYMVVQGLTKEDRDKGLKGAILGNGKILGQGNKPQPAARPAPARANPKPVDDSSPPF